jgi:hypothetical protein
MLLAHETRNFQEEEEEGGFVISLVGQGDHEWEYWLDEIWW